jgi:hypothetical protein
MEEKVCLEIAEQDFQRMVVAADVDVDGMSDLERADFEETKRKFVRLIQRGKMVVGDDGLPTLITGTESVPELKFKTPYSDTVIAQGDIPGDNNAAQGRAMISVATDVPRALISTGVKGRDFLLAQRIINFFLVD